MPRKRDNPGGQATAIQFSGLNGKSAQVPTLQGTVNYKPPQTVKEPIEDVHSPIPQYKTSFKYGSISMTLVLPVDTSWIRSDVISDSLLNVTFLNGFSIAFSGVTMTGDGVEQDLTAGTTNELTFTFVSSTES